MFLPKHPISALLLSSAVINPTAQAQSLSGECSNETLAVTWRVNVSYDREQEGHEVISCLVKLYPNGDVDLNASTCQTVDNQPLALVDAQFYLSEQTCAVEGTLDVTARHCRLPATDRTGLWAVARSPHGGFVEWVR